VCLLAIPALAQSINGSIGGRVMDPSGAVIPSAKVSVKNLETGITREVETDASGVYSFRALPVGNYSLSYSSAGFATMVREPISVTMSAVLSLDVTLETGVTREIVSVTEQAPLIDATQSQLTKAVNSTAIMELPGLNQLTGLALLMPGAAASQNGRPGSGYVMNGGRTRSNNFMIDGANNVDETVAIPRLNLVPEYIQSVTVITNNFSAEYGRNSSSVLTQITQSGTNQFHGTERWVWQGNGFNAMSTGAERTFNSFKSQGLSDYLALRKARAVVVDNQGVLSLGGPIKKDKSFFFLGYDHDWYRTTAVPTTAAISPDSFSTLQQYQSTFAPGVLDVLKTYFPVANDPTPRGTINIQVPNGPLVPVAIQQYSPGLKAPLSYAISTSRGMAKNDTRLGENNTLTTRYVIYDYADPGAPSALPNNQVGQASRVQSITLNDTHVFSPTLLNEARVTFSRSALHFPENLPEYFSISGFNSIGNTSYPQWRVVNDWEYMDNLTMIRGRHTIKTGANIFRINADSYFPANLDGSITYGSLSDLLFDKNATFSRYTGVPDFDAITWELGGFVQDDFRVKPNFTLNLGARYEYASAPLGYFSNAKPDLNNFAPRVGFAWSPHASSGLMEKILGDGKTSIHGGFGMTYDQIFQNVLSNVFRNYPRGINYSVGNVSGAGYYLQSKQPTVPTPEQYAAQGLNVNALDYRNWSTNNRIALPYMMQFSLGVERQLRNNFVVRLGYVGSRGVKLMREVETNYGFAAAAVNANPATFAGIINNLKYSANIPALNGPGYRIDPTIGGRVVGGPLAQSTYHSMQASLEKRFANGFQFSANYTWSSMIDDADDILGGAVNSTVPAYPFNYKLDKARSGFDVPQRLVINYVYQLPFFKAQKGFAGRALGGWELSGITTLSSGIPYTVYNANNALGTITNGQLSTVYTNQRASINPNGVPGAGTSAGLANPYYIANPTNSGVIGNLGRNTLRTGGTNNFDVSLQKSVRLFGERQRLQFRWEMLDVMNHRNFTTIPANTVSNATNLTTFLNLGQTSVVGRSMTFLVRYSF
jgi:hypothetical protein